MRTLWTPERYERTSTMERAFGTELEYGDLWDWSVRKPESFWSWIPEFFGVTWHTEPARTLEGEGVEGTRWFPGATVNYAGESLRWTGTTAAIREVDRVLSWDDLRAATAGMAQELESLGVGPGDVVAGFLPNRAEAVIAMLATVSRGATWTAVSPALETPAALTRLHRARPKLVVAQWTYPYRGRQIERLDVIDQLETVSLVSPEHTAKLIAQAHQPYVLPVPFDHPLWLCHTSGTTGKPKPVLLSHGGIIVEHYKALGLHYDVQGGDVHGWYTDPSWIVWHQTVSVLMLGATLALYDGSLGQVPRFIDGVSATSFGLSPAALTRLRERCPDQMRWLGRLRSLAVSGSPLSADLATWVYQATRNPNLYLHNLSGGTELGTAVVGGSPTLPVWAGELSCRWLGADVRVRDGEMVIANALPSMPLEKGPWMVDGLWAHGDHLTPTERGSVVLSGRCDAALNRDGIRVGTAEVYEVVESMPGVDDSLIVHRSDDDQLWLFVVGPAGESHEFFDAVRVELRRRVGRHTMPDVVVSVAAIPRTLTGKKMEVPVKQSLSGEPGPVSDVDPPGALDALLAAAQRGRVR